MHENYANHYINDEYILKSFWNSKSFVLYENDKIISIIGQIFGENLKRERPDVKIL